MMSRVASPCGPTGSGVPPGPSTTSEQVASIPSAATRDALMPAAAYQQFADAARQRAAPYCGVGFAQADHQLRAPGSDRLQQLWRWLDQAASAAATHPWNTGRDATISLQDCAAWQAEAARP